MTYKELLLIVGFLETTRLLVWIAQHKKVNTIKKKMKEEEDEEERTIL